MPVPQLPTELICHILSLLPFISLGGPVVPMPVRTQTLSSCSLVNKTFQHAAQRELGKHLSWRAPDPDRVHAFLRSPSCPAVWGCESLWIRDLGAGDLFGILSRAESVKELTLLMDKSEFVYTDSYSIVPDSALGAVAGERPGENSYQGSATAADRAHTLTSVQYCTLSLLRGLRSTSGRLNLPT